MGYEIIYHFHPEVTKGEYNKEDTQTSSIKVGGPYEDIGVEVVAGKVMALMARRNILVTQVEIFEVCKKQISFKEVEDGIVVKNRKFKFDDGPAMSGGEIIAEKADDPAQVLAKLLAENPQLVTSLAKPVSQAPQSSSTAMVRQPSPNLGRPIRHEAFSPLMDSLSDADRLTMKDLKFTKNKRYPIFDEKPSGNSVRNGMKYTTVDDLGRKQVLPDRFFIPTNQLSFDGSSDGGLVDSGLRWDGVIGNTEQVPDLRRR